MRSPRAERPAVSSAQERRPRVPPLHGTRYSRHREVCRPRSGTPSWQDRSDRRQRRNRADKTRSGETTCRSSNYSAPVGQRAPGDRAATRRQRAPPRGSARPPSSSGARRGRDSRYTRTENRLDVSTKPDAAHRPGLLGGITVLRGVVTDTAGSRRQLTAIPYYAWSHRGAGEMAVWLRRGHPAAQSGMK